VEPAVVEVVVVVVSGQVVAEAAVVSTGSVVEPAVAVSLAAQRDLPVQRVVSLADNLPEGR
jgi:hypothetical protein